MQSICIDRLEEGVAVCQDESGAKLEIPAVRLPAGAMEGDWLLFDGARFFPDPERTRREREKVKNLFHSLKKRRNSDG
ncbi:DUF3006 domain-containing protein [Zongyangia hominis]|uniref:DUF3006 domain-containing protein n=1 Tax=Zongyangia hominis TaxID=2763677 RepID=A0A926EF06_9FIRM|nr:DUF3006 domain-containing protein [Zongyangia hominis]MBC8570954.1 DUF3006 domain-containing protein [Zongyangia hominis]